MGLDDADSRAGCSGVCAARSDDRKAHGQRKEEKMDWKCEMQPGSVV